jgi:hypothetical protein
MMFRFAKCSYKQCANVLCYENADCLGITGRILKNVIGILPGSPIPELVPETGRNSMDETHRIALESQSRLPAATNPDI